MAEVLHPPEGIELTERGIRFASLRNVNDGKPVEIECEVDQRLLDRLRLAQENGRQAALRLQRLLNER